MIKTATTTFGAFVMISGLLVAGAENVGSMPEQVYTSVLGVLGFAIGAYIIYLVNGRQHGRL